MRFSAARNFRLPWCYLVEDFMYMCFPELEFINCFFQMRLNKVYDVYLHGDGTQHCFQPFKRCSFFLVSFLGRIINKLQFCLVVICICNTHAFPLSMYKLLGIFQKNRSIYTKCLIYLMIDTNSQLEHQAHQFLTNDITQNMRLFCWQRVLALKRFHYE